MRIIDGDVLFEDLKECMKDSRLAPLQINGIALAATRIFEQPTIEPERKKGQWNIIKGTGLASCECGHITDRYSTYDFCPVCGARMER